MPTPVALIVAGSGVPRHQRVGPIHPDGLGVHQPVRQVGHFA